MTNAPSSGPVRSFDTSGREVIATPTGALGHRLLVEHGEVLHPEFYKVTDGVWCLVGNGLSNQTFVDAPEGIIAIDTGESIEEMRAAIAALRTVTDRPIAAVIYSHFHYVNGTRAVFEDAGREVPVYGHTRVVANRMRATDEVGPTYNRGLVQQFGVNLPAEGPDGLIHVGLGVFYRNPKHHPFTNGFVPPTHTIDQAVSLTIAGAKVDITLAPSDSDDSITIWFADRKVCVHNIVWPVLFNIYAIRGEQNRDPQVLLEGIDHIRTLPAEHLVCTHGPPLSGAKEIERVTTRSRDAIQFLWDQTVRGMNKGWTADEIASRVRLPELYEDDFHTSERYGVVEHHVRQIGAGLRGWFDGDPAKLFPLEPRERAQRLIDGFGGRSVVRAQRDRVLESDDLRWATELATWLVSVGDATDEAAAKRDVQALAEIIRRIGQRSPAANIRNWCLTRARDLDGSASMSRHRVHQLRRPLIETDPMRALATLRVLLDPDRAAGLDVHVRFELGGGRVAGLHVRNAVACPTDGSNADLVARLDAAALADILTGTTPAQRVVDDGRVVVEGPVDRFVPFFDCFDL